MKHYINQTEKLTQHFKLCEFFPNQKYRILINKKGGDGLDGLTDDEYKNLLKLANSLESIRQVAGRQIRITSGYRTLEQNKQAGGAVGSRHCCGLAADFYLCGIGISLEQLFEFYQKQTSLLSQLGIAEFIYYPKRGIIHVGLKRNAEENKLFVSINRS